MDGHDHDGSADYDGGTHPPSHDDPSFESTNEDFYADPETLWGGGPPDHSTPADHDWLADHPSEHDLEASYEEGPDLYSDLPHHFATDVDTGPDHEPDVDQTGDHTPEEPAFGVDPDLPPEDLTHPVGDWLDLPDLDHLTVPEPAGGAPWLDLSLLGDHAHQTVEIDDLRASALDDHPASALDDLRAALGEPPAVDAAYDQLLTSDDPAVRTLAHLWAPPR